MASQATSIANRLLEAESPCRFQDWEEKDGYYIATCRVAKEDIPGLIDIASKWSDPDWSGDDLGLDPDLQDTDWLPVTAWRTLADLKASEAVEPLAYMLTNFEDEPDDWTSDELPHVFGKIGKPALGAMVQLADDADQPDFLRKIAAAALHRIAEYHTETRDDVVAALAQMMTKADRRNIEFNSILLVGLVELRAVEAAETIERAFAGDCLDVGMMGDWEDVQRTLGVDGLGLEMPEHPHNSIEQFRRRMGIGVFSERPIYDEGEVNPDAEQAYYEQAWDAFAPSQEAKRFVDRFGDLGWFQMLLEFGLRYRGEIIDEIGLGGVDEFLFDYVPRKVSTEPERATEIVLELTLFWEYLQRVYELPNAKSIIEWLKTDGLVARLQAELSDPANFGMAKSIFMSGKAAGYDMTSEKGTAEYMAAYNRSLQPAVPSAPAPVISGREKIGRNDPCPCGSGKKFKKCCR